jgi:ABC-2 type transport system ATP-binding protein
MIKINNISKTYHQKNTDIKALDNINLEINTGEITCLLGHNGAGKTTLIKCISDLIVPCEGAIYINDIIVNQKTAIARKEVGAVLEGSRNIYYYLTPEENLKYFGLLNNLTSKQIKERSDYFLDIFDLEDRRKEVVNNFSRGMQQKVAIMVTLMKNPSILLLDEPTLGLDIVSSTIVKNIIQSLAKNMKKTVIISTHDINLIEDLQCRLIFMNKGKVVKDDIFENIKNNFSNKEIFEISMANDSFEKIRKSINLEDVTYKQEEFFTTVYVSDINWIKHNINNIDFQSISKSNPSFEEVYTSIMKVGE